ncbi:MAG: class I SAM-dependent methyltransferase, partial [Cyanobacteria bacterium J06558_2]
MNSIGHHSLSIQWQKIRQRINSSLANVFNQSLSKDFYYSCVVDATPLFYWQSWGLVNSLIQCAKVLPQQIYVHCTPEVDRAFLEQLKTLGINLKAIERFGDGKYCNKIAQLKTEELTRAKCVFLLDTDTIVLGQLTEVYTDNVIKGKIVDLANPQLSVLQEIFTQAGFSDHPAICSADYEADLTFANNFNGGFYAVPGNLIKHLGERWHYWALWLIENCSILKRINKQDHVDQISFAMASHELSLSVEQINRQFNYPLHLEEEKTGYPRVIHYHRNISPTGMLEVTGEQDSEFSLAVEDANRLLGRCFNNQIFWSFRYQMYAELGSGVGSRGENLNYKRELLRKLGIETSQSILDVGCGDLEVIKAFKLSNYTGVDISSQAIELARQKRPDLNFILLENNLSIPAADLVICLEVLIHQHN